MSFPFNATGINTNGPILPDGWYKFEIIEANDRDKEGGPKTTKNGDPMVNLTCLVVDDPRYPNTRVFHNLVFLPKDKPGAGMAIHFLKCIGEPWEGEIEIDPDHWVFAHARFMGKVGTREYNGKTYKQILEISPVKDTNPPPQEAKGAKTTKRDEIPF